MEGTKTVLINNAGFCYVGPVETFSLDTSDYQDFTLSFFKRFDAAEKKSNNNKFFFSVY